MVRLPVNCQSDRVGGQTLSISDFVDQLVDRLLFPVHSERVLIPLKHAQNRGQLVAGVAARTTLRNHVDVTSR